MQKNKFRTTLDVSQSFKVLPVLKVNKEERRAKLRDWIQDLKENKLGDQSTDVSTDFAVTIGRRRAESDFADLIHKKSDSDFAKTLYPQSLEMKEKSPYFKENVNLNLPKRRTLIKRRSESTINGSKTWKLILETQLKFKKNQITESKSPANCKFDDLDLNDRADLDNELEKPKTATKSDPKIRPLSKSSMIRQNIILARQYSEQEEAKENNYHYLTHKGLRLPQIKKKTQ